MQITLTGQRSFAEMIAQIRVEGRLPFCLQIGAMDGKQFDLAYPYLSQPGKWAGLLVEPMEDMFAALVKNYAGNPGIKFANLAVAEHDGEIMFSRFDPAGVAAQHVPEEALGVSSMVPERGMIGHTEYRRTHPRAYDYLQKFAVPCVTLPTLLAQNQVAAIDMMIIDTEGADWIILRQLDLAKYRPRLIFFEFKHVPQAELEQCLAHMQKAGYNSYLCKEEEWNILFSPD